MPRYPVVMEAIQDTEDVSPPGRATSELAWWNTPRGGEGQASARAYIGATIASYRRQHRQIHNGKPWSQEDLAVAIGSDKAHVNRIENGRRIPARETLIRTCRSLGMAWDEEQELLIAAGHAPDLRFPDEADLEAIIARVSSFIDGLPHPAILVDVIERCWYWNPFAVAFFGLALGTRSDELTGSWQGRSLLDLYFAPRPTLPFRRLFCRGHIIRALARLRRRAGVWQWTPEYRSMIQRFARSSAFPGLWRESLAIESEVAYTDHALATIHDARLGALLIEVRWTRLLKDQRFLVSSFLPADQSAHQAFAIVSAGLSA